jgi:hypothetical protein
MLALLALLALLLVVLRSMRVSVAFRRLKQPHQRPSSLGRRVTRVCARYAVHARYYGYGYRKGAAAQRGSGTARKTKGRGMLKGRLKGRVG